MDLMNLHSRARSGISRLVNRYEVCGTRYAARGKQENIIIQGERWKTLFMFVGSGLWVIALWIIALLRYRLLRYDFFRNNEITK